MLHDIISQVPEQVTGGGGKVKMELSSSRVSWKNTEALLAGTRHLGFASFERARRSPILTLNLWCRKNVYGSPTTRPPTIFSKVLATCTRNRPSLWNYSRRSLIGVLPQLRVRFTHISCTPTLNCELRRCAQTTQEGHGARVRSCRSQAFVSVLLPVFQFSQSLLYPGSMVDVEVERLVVQ